MSIKIDDLGRQGRKIPGSRHWRIRLKSDADSELHSNLVACTSLRLSALVLASTLLPIRAAQQPNQIETGHTLFQNMCSACHGSQAKGGRGPDLTTGRWKWGSTDSVILQTASGSPVTYTINDPTSFGVIGYQSNTPRNIQLSLKVNF